MSCYNPYFGKFFTGVFRFLVAHKYVRARAAIGATVGIYGAVYAGLRTHGTVDAHGRPIRNDTPLIATAAWNAMILSFGCAFIAPIGAGLGLACVVAAIIDL